MARQACRLGSLYFCSGRGIAYNPTKDWVYVSDLYTNTVKVFGPPASGTAPDVTSQPADGITKTEATAHGTINPQGLPNAYHFEWVRGEAQHLTVEATGGSFGLAMTAAEGHGHITSGSNVITEVLTYSGAFRVGDPIDADGFFPSGTTITAVGAETLTLSAGAESKGDDGVELPAGGRSVELTGSEITGPIGWNAPAKGSESVEAALEALPIGAGNISVEGIPASDTGAPGEYDVLFENGLAGQVVAEMKRFSGPSGRFAQSLRADGQPGSGLGSCRTTTRLARSEPQHRTHRQRQPPGFPSSHRPTSEHYLRLPPGRHQHRARRRLRKAP